VNEVSCFLGSLAHKLPDVVCESVDEELQRVRDFTCRSQHYKNGPCYRQFSSETALNCRSEMKSLTEGKRTISFCFPPLYYDYVCTAF